MSSVPADRLVEPFESLFEQHVFQKIAERGYRVIPQYEVAGYRIDLVVEGMRGRLAVECDGEAWHGPEQYQHDMARQRDLERCDWQFWRLPGSAFYRDPDRALEGLWTRLSELNIFPQGLQSSEVGGPRDAAPTGGERDTAMGSTEASYREQIAMPSSEDDLHVEFPVGFLEPYVEWPGGRVPDPRESDRVRVAEGLFDIISVEGPVLVSRAFRIYARACGYQRTGHQIQAALRRALAALRQKGRVTVEEELDEEVARAAGTGRVRERQRGSRTFEDIPPFEVGEQLKRLKQEWPALDTEELYRKLLERYELRRMTRPVKARLDRIAPTVGL